VGGSRTFSEAVHDRWRPRSHQLLMAPSSLRFLQRTLVRVPSFPDERGFLASMTDASQQQQSGSYGAVVIAGGGFAGFCTSPGLAERRHTRSITADRGNDSGVFRLLPLLYELLSGELRSLEVAPSYDNLLAGTAWPGCGIG